MEKIYVFGHRKPDTDSVSAAIAVAHLKQELGLNAIPVILSDINYETEYALNYFKVPIPKFLNDVKSKIKDVKYRKDCLLNINSSLYDAYNLMIKNKFNKLAITDSDKKFLGTISMTDIAKYLINEKSNKLISNYDSILNVTEGNSLTKYDDIIDGNLIVASYKSTTFINDVKLDHKSILVVGDRHSIIEYAVNSGALMIILTGKSEIKKEHLAIAKKNKVNIIRVSADTASTIQKIVLANLIDQNYINTTSVCVDENETIENFTNLVDKTGHTYFPVINKNNKCLGIVTLNNLNDKTKAKVILVDHNSFEQSVEGIKDAEILEVIDHHNIGSITSAKPISFRNMAVGSSNTIIYQLYKENNIKIPKEIAGLMLSGILSDTLILNSPTTTDLDRETVKFLSKTAGVNYEKYGMDLLRAGASVKGKTKEELIYQDFKAYPYEDMKLGVGQLSTTNPEVFLDEKNEYINLLNSLSFENEFKIMALFVTDILKQGSYVLYNDAAKDKLEKAFNIKDFKQGIFLKGVVSRKLQVIPVLIDNEK